jgi:hypothetical protein
MEMERTTFDAMTRMLGGGLSRRGTLRGLAADAVAAVTGGVALGAASAGSGDRKAKRCKKSGAACSSNNQCCPKQTKRLCKVPTGGSSCDTFCCSGIGTTYGPANVNAGAVGLLRCANIRCRTGDPDDPNLEPGTPGAC